MNNLLHKKILLTIFGFGLLCIAQDDIEYIDSDACLDCHEESKHKTTFEDDLSHSVHEGFECLDCHTDREILPHDEDTGFRVGCEGCRICHDDADVDYVAHGREDVSKCGDIPMCSDCHGTHDVLPSSVKNSSVHPTNLPQTCGKCHENLDLIKKHELMLDHPIEMYEGSVHGKATKGGIYVAATCNDCHSTEGTSHKIYSPGHQESSINHFNIPKTCGVCHKGVENDYWEGIHGKLVARGETDSPICTDCHGEHGIISPDDPHSPVSAAKVAEQTCSPCHESTTLNEKYGLPSGKLTTFVDSYHGLKSKAGNKHVANCASCHGVHRILPSTDPTSTINPENLQETCGECHPGISAKLAAAPIHGVSGEGLRTPLANIIEIIYFWIIFVTIGLMLLHWTLDWVKQIRSSLKKPQVRRMRIHEVWQHTFLMLSFIVLVVSGFALRFSESWIGKIFYAFEGGYEIRGLIHRISAIIFIITIIWHLLFVLLTKRGKTFFIDMLPKWKDAKQLWERLLFYVGRRKEIPKFGRFSYVEKAEYWALVWGTVVMVVTGLLLWFDNFFISFLPKGFLDVALVIHYWEAWLATLAILVWHLYSTIYSPDVYPMNTAWLTGTMTEEQYAHEHPEHLEEAKRETERAIREDLRRMATYRSTEKVFEKVKEEKLEKNEPDEKEATK
ncbi:MAG: cytochrome b/b6 domain-containing protein [Candidatus Marinimicrobia bacterium]|nr:cytochrome b/b6 domain-containing protein [Candidatus Neomarinimicrobiota bacterium]